jgi:hypothetical protein
VPRVSRRVLVVAAVIGCVAMLGLVLPKPVDRSDGTEASLVQGGSGRAEVTYQPTVRAMDRDKAMAGLLGVGSDGRVLFFAKGTQDVEALAPGDVLLIKGLSARKILAVGQDDAGPVLFTESATITDTLRDGDIKLELPVRFVEQNAKKAEHWRSGHSWRSFAGTLLPSAHAQSPDAEKIRDAIKKGNADAYANLAKGAVAGVFEGWDVKYAAVPSAKGRLDLSITMTKNVGGFLALITAKGYLSDFDVSSHLLVKRGTLEQLELLHKKLNGVMEFSWEVAKDTPGALSGDDRIKLPAALSIPLSQFLNGLPLFLEISAAAIIKPAISGGKQYSQGSFRVTYDGYQGFKATQKGSQVDAQVKGDIAFLRSQNISALAPQGMVVAFAAPRIELSFGTTKMFDGADFKTPAKAVDLIADQLVKRVFGKDTADRLQAAGFSMSKAVENSVESDATGYVELVVSSGMSHTGFSVIEPCTRTDMHMYVKVGASAQLFGTSFGETKREIFERSVTRIDPPSARLCEAVSGK